MCTLVAIARGGQNPDRACPRRCAQVVEILADSLTLPETPVPSKVARLMLVSDVLHNSTASVRNASRYRSLLEAALPDVFESLQVRRPCMMQMSWRLPHREWFLLDFLAENPGQEQAL